MTLQPVAVPVIYPAAPGSLTERGRVIWDLVIRSRPSDHFDAVGRLLIEALCRHVEAAEDITRERERELQQQVPNDRRVEMLGKMRALETSAMLSISTRLRLTAQSMATPASARRAALDAQRAASEKPWTHQERKAKAKPKTDSAA
jgi:hypothetical protein